MHDIEINSLWKLKTKNTGIFTKWGICIAAHLFSGYIAGIISYNVRVYYANGE